MARIIARLREVQYDSAEGVRVETRFRVSIVVSISACHADDPGSIPGRGVFVFVAVTSSRRRSIVALGVMTKLRYDGISGLVVEYIVAIDVTRVRFPADALFVNFCCVVEWSDFFPGLQFP